MAGVALRRGHLERAAELFGTAAAYRESHAVFRAQAYEGLYGAAVVALRRALGDDRFEAAWAAGRALPLDEAVARAMELAGAGQPAAVDPRLAASPPPAVMPYLPPAPALLAPVLPDGLTPREAEVLRLLADGRTSTEIAEALVLSVRTVNNHITHLCGKIGARNRAEATAYALRHGLISFRALSP
jgi:DNA-binding CsgD family transcriptional regulator